jgi:hypothetical protein
MRKLAALTAIALGIIVLASACGGQGESTVKPSPTATVAATPTTTPTPASGSGVRPFPGTFGTDLGHEAGTSLPERGFALTFEVIEGQGDMRLHSVLLACGTGNGGAVSVAQVGDDIEIEGGGFRVESTDVVIEGRFVIHSRAEGTIRALTGKARDCGVPDQGQWTAEWSVALPTPTATPAPTPMPTPAPTPAVDTEITVTNLTPHMATFTLRGPEEHSAALDPCGDCLPLTDGQAAAALRALELWVGCLEQGQQQRIRVPFGNYRITINFTTPAGDPAETDGELFLSSETVSPWAQPVACIFYAESLVFRQSDGFAVESKVEPDGFIGILEQPIMTPSP